MSGGYRRAVIDVLERNRYRKLPDRGKGSHEAWSNGTRTQIVPRNIDDRAFANRIMRQADIDHHFR